MPWSVMIVVYNWIYPWRCSVHVHKGEAFYRVVRRRRTEK